VRAGNSSRHNKLVVNKKARIRVTGYALFYVLFGIFKRYLPHLY
jgi:hypothetical protein